MGGGEVIVGESGNGRTIELAVGQTLELRLPETPTTGFRWHVVAKGEPVCTLAGDTFTAPSGQPGRGGEHCWTFTAIRPGEGDIALRYRRRWESAGDAERSFKVHLRVGGEGRVGAPRP